jgi:hypothetical protein
MFVFDLIGFWLGVTASYVIAVALIGAGLYLAIVLSENPVVALFRHAIRFAGVVLIALGCILGAYTFGKATGAEACEAAWKAKNYEAQIGRLKQEADAKKIAANVAEDQAQQLASANDDLQKKVGEYQTAAVGYAACRRATGDDDRRVCDITGRSAAGCHPAR